jgi:hypothetical protein
MPLLLGSITIKDKEPRRWWNSGISGYQIKGPFSLCETMQNSMDKTAS